MARMKIFNTLEEEAFELTSVFNSAERKRLRSTGGVMVVERCDATGMVWWKSSHCPVRRENVGESKGVQRNCE